MNLGKMRTIHRRLGISLVCFLLIQAIAGTLMSIGRLAAADTSKIYNVLYSIHADWDPLGSIYRLILGLATAMQGILGVMIFLNRSRFETGDKATSFVPSSPDQSYQSKKEVPMGALSFAADIRPLFRSYDVESMKPNGIDLSSYVDVKKHAQDIYARLSGKDMPCDGEWNEGDLKKIKEWIDSGMQP